jgi:hypothetical protein
VNPGSALTNPFSSGGGGNNFENSVQALFTVLLLTGGFAPCLSPIPIKRIILQGKYAGYETDDCVICLEGRSAREEPKLLTQIKHKVSITEKDSVFADAVGAAWRDFNNGTLFVRDRDALALITGPLSATDIDHARTILDWARSSATADEFFLAKVAKSKFSSQEKQAKLAAFRAVVEKANGQPVADQEFWQFLRHYHLLGYDLDVTSGVTLSLLNSHIAQFKVTNVEHMFGSIAKFVGSFDQNAGTITLETIPEDIRKVFGSPTPQATIPAQFVQSQPTRPAAVPLPTESATALASLLGSWHEGAQGDQDVIRELIEGNDKE